jgi:type I restriction enzyme S subunit
MKLASDYGLITKTSSKVTIAHFTSEQFKKFKIMLPPIDLQNKFASIVEMIESIREHQKESTKEINLLFDALMQKAFAGELV